jgi:hypothetical protein
VNGRHGDVERIRYETLKEDNMRNRKTKKEREIPLKNNIGSHSRRYTQIAKTNETRLFSPP